MAANESASMDERLDDEAVVSFVEIATWLGEGKGTIAVVTLVATLLAAAWAFTRTPIYTASTALLAPNAQQSSGTNALATLAAAGVLGGSVTKTPDEFYTALLKSNSVLRSLDERFQLREHYHFSTFEALRRGISGYIRVTPDKKSGLITVSVDDEDPKFAAELANAHLPEVSKVLGRLAVSEAQQRRKFFEQQLGESKESLVKAEQALRAVQEKSGVVVLDKQAEALIIGASEIRARIAEREVQLKVLRTGATERNPEVMRLSSELAALRAELQRMESNSDGPPGGPADIPVGRLPEASIEYIRAQRNLKLQETLLEAMVRQFEIAKLDEAKEAPSLQLVDKAAPPDHKSKPSRLTIIVVGFLLGLFGSIAVIVARRYSAQMHAQDPQAAQTWRTLISAWRWRR